VRLEGKVALITGAESAFGIATALRFAREGAHVVLNDIGSTRLDRVVTEIAEEEGGRALIVLGDVTRSAHVERMVREALDAFGRVDILVSHGPAPDVDTVVQGAALCANAVLPGMRERRWGRVIHMGPVGAIGGAVTTPPGLIVLTKKLALECARDGITVNCVVPGVMAEAQLTFDAAAKTIDPVIPMGRIGDPRDIAAACVFFASDEAAYVTGQVLHVDGGLSVSG
jgi:NAD(P)-dependent dehydrogenase (short-subunit alcohol dehydrogenase family)